MGWRWMAVDGMGWRWMAVDGMEMDGMEMDGGGWDGMALGTPSWMGTDGWGCVGWRPPRRGAALTRKEQRKMKETK